MVAATMAFSTTELRINLHELLAVTFHFT